MTIASSERRTVHCTSMFVRIAVDNDRTLRLPNRDNTKHINQEVAHEPMQLSDFHGVWRSSDGTCFECAGDRVYAAWGSRPRQCLGRIVWLGSMCAIFAWGNCAPRNMHAYKKDRQCLLWPDGDTWIKMQATLHLHTIKEACFSVYHLGTHVDGICSGPTEGHTDAS